MYEVLDKILGTAILLILWCSGTLGKSRSLYSSMENATDGSDFVSRQNLILYHFLNNHKFPTQLERIKSNKIIGHSNNLIEKRSDEPRSYYGVSAPAFIPTFDPISVLASLAFFAFLLQSFAALFDRTRSTISTFNSRQSKFDYNEHFFNKENEILRALEEYASLTKDLLNKKNESKTFVF